KRDERRVSREKSLVPWHSSLGTRPSTLFLLFDHLDLFQISDFVLQIWPSIASLLHRDLHATGSQAQLGTGLVALVLQNNDGDAILILHRQRCAAPGDRKSCLGGPIGTGQIARTLQIVNFPR